MVYLNTRKLERYFISSGNLSRFSRTMTVLGSSFPNFCSQMTSAYRKSGSASAYRPAWCKETSGQLRIVGWSFRKV